MAGKRIFLTQSEMQVLHSNLSLLKAGAPVRLSRASEDRRVLGNTEENIVGNILKKVNRHRD